MRQTLSKGMVAAAAATSILSLCGSPAIADSHTGGAAKDSPGVLSGNSVQAPLEIPVNACGDSVDVIAALNPAFGNSCANGPAAHKGGSHGSHGHHGSYGGHGSGYGDDDECEGGYGGYGDDCGGETPPPTKPPHTPPTKPPHTPPTSPPTTPPHTPPTTPPTGPPTTPPTTPPHTPPTSPPHTPPTGPPTSPPTTPPHTPPTTPPTGPPHTPPTTPPYTPPTSPPTGPPHTPPTTTPPTTPPQLPHTGSSGEALLGASGVSAAMIAAGAILYRRGRAASRR